MAGRRHLWTKNKPSSDYTDDRSTHSEGIGFVLDFGMKRNDKYWKGYTTLPASFGVNEPYHPITNNCCAAFIRGMDSIRKEIGVPKINKPTPSAIREYILKYLWPKGYVKQVVEFPKH